MRHLLLFLVLATTLTGDLLQTATGSINFDVMLGPLGIEIDQLFVTGDIDLGGGVAALSGTQGLAGTSAGTGLGGSVVFNLADALSLTQLLEGFSIFDFFLGGTPDAPTVLTDSSLFADLTFMSVTAAGTIELLVSSDGSLAPIPVPAAVWLFGSALGLLGWARRRAS